jgi:hypothetical protein
VKSSDLQEFPRDAFGRVVIALASAFFGILFWSLAVAVIYGAKPDGALELMFFVAAEELFFVLALLCTCGLIWALATPRWMERALDAIVRKLLLALALFAIPLFALGIWTLSNA